MKVKCIMPWGLLEKDKTYTVLFSGTNAYTVALPGGRPGFFSKERFEVVPELPCGGECNPMCGACREQGWVQL